jgi:hypothetical protein
MGPKMTDHSTAQSEVDQNTRVSLPWPTRPFAFASVRHSGCSAVAKSMSLEFVKSAIVAQGNEAQCLKWTGQRGALAGVRLPVGLRVGKHHPDVGWMAQVVDSPDSRGMRLAKWPVSHPATDVSVCEFRDFHGQIDCFAPSLFNGCAPHPFNHYDYHWSKKQNESQYDRQKVFYILDLVFVHTCLLRQNLN